MTVTRPDLVESTVSAPPATKSRGTNFLVTDAVQNLGAVASGASATRHYLSLDVVKSPSDMLMTGSRSVPAWPRAPAIPAPSRSRSRRQRRRAYFLLACADTPNTVLETNEGNNCKASSITVTVTP